MVRPTVNSEKHLVQQSIATVLQGAVTTIDIADAVDVYTGAADEVRVGAIVKAIYIEKWLKAQDTATGNFVLTIEKLPSNLAPIGAANMGALHGYANKKNIFYVTQGLSNDQDADATPVLRNWIKIPKGKQRMGKGDKIVMNIFAQALDITHCGVEIYKEYF